MGFSLWYLCVWAYELVYACICVSFFFLLLFFTTVLSPWEIWVASAGESQLRQSCYPTYDACWMFKCFHNPPNSDMDYTHTNLNLTVDESTEVADSGFHLLEWLSTKFPVFDLLFKLLTKKWKENEHFISPWLQFYNCHMCNSIYCSVCVREREREKERACVCACQGVLRFIKWSLMQVCSYILKNIYLLCYSATLILLILLIDNM